MSLSIAIVQNGDETRVMFGEWKSKEEAQRFLDDAASTEVALAVEQYHGDEHSPNAEVLEVMALSADREHSIGRDLERLMQCTFDLGRKFERSAAPTAT